MSKLSGKKLDYIEKRLKLGSNRKKLQKIHDLGKRNNTWVIGSNKTWIIADSSSSFSSYNFDKNVKLE